MLYYIILYYIILYYIILHYIILCYIILYYIGIIIIISITAKWRAVVPNGAPSNISVLI